MADNASNAGIIKKISVKSLNKVKTIIANEIIREGEVLGAAIGPIVAKTRSRFALMVDNSNKNGTGRRPKIVTQNKFKYISHSENPNVMCDNGVFIAIRKIWPKTRITMDFQG